MLRTRSCLTGIFTLLALIAPGPGHGAGIETLLMPGKVASAHAKFETECTRCHDRTDRSRQTALCMDCHKGIAHQLPKDVEG